MGKKIFIKTFGCQMNEYDSNRIFHSVKKIGFEKTEDQKNADCFLLNTCHIRDKAKEKVYHEIGRVKKIYKKKLKPIVVVAGCVAQAENEEMLKREPYIDIVIGPQSYHKINNVLDNYVSKKQREETEFDTISKFDFFDKIENKSNKVSAFLTIQEGCDKFCHFCVVPFTRGLRYGSTFSLISPGKKPNLSPASTAGLDNIIRSIFFSNNIVNATATARNVFPVPAGPAEIIISFSLSALTYFFCFSECGITDFFGVLIIYSIFFSEFFIFSLIINLLTDEIISSFSIDPLIIN